MGLVLIMHEYPVDKHFLYLKWINEHCTFISEVPSEVSRIKQIDILCINLIEEKCITDHRVKLP